MMAQSKYHEITQLVEALGLSWACEKVALQTPQLGQAHGAPMLGPGFRTSAYHKGSFAWWYPPCWVFLGGLTKEPLRMEAAVLGS